MTGPRAVRVVLADDHAVVRDGLRALVSAQAGLEVVGEAGDADQAWRLTCDLKPDVLVLDLSMPGGGGASAAERVRRDCPRVRVLALTMHEESGYVARLLGAGASGYLLKRSASAELVRAIRAVAAGGSYVDPSLAGALLTAQAAGRGPAARDGGGLNTLTTRELEVLRLVAEGHTNKEVGASLAISVKTVETHRAHAMTKVGLASRAALVRAAVAWGWLGGGAERRAAGDSGDSLSPAD